MKTSYHLNPDWYRAKYNLASEYLGWAQNGSAAKRRKRLRKAEKCVVELLDQIAATLRRRPWGRQAWDPEVRSLRRFIAAEVRLNDKFLLARIALALQPREAAKDGEAAKTVTGEPASLVQAAEKEGADTTELSYSLARLFAQVGDRDAAREHLEAAVGKADPSEWPVLAHRIARDPVFSDIEMESIESAAAFSPLMEAAEQEVRE